QGERLPTPIGVAISSGFERPFEIIALEMKSSTDALGVLLRKETDLETIGGPMLLLSPEEHPSFGTIVLEGAAMMLSIGWPPYLLFALISALAPRRPPIN